MAGATASRMHISAASPRTNAVIGDALLTCTGTAGAKRVLSRRRGPGATRPGMQCRSAAIRAGHWRVQRTFDGRHNVRIVRRRAARPTADHLPVATDEVLVEIPLRRVAGGREQVPVQRRGLLAD